MISSSEKSLNILNKDGDIYTSDCLVFEDVHGDDRELGALPLPNAEYEDNEEPREQRGENNGRRPRKCYTSLSHR